mmetsp:Transcript_32681/g.66724  ORF Transcript_32681/g.66724 Transcript_32681/m.66724 type:complete len:81 (+) Transcript_32681:355-597(+)
MMCNITTRKMQSRSVGVTQSIHSARSIQSVEQPSGDHTSSVDASDRQMMMAMDDLETLSMGTSNQHGTTNKNTKSVAKYG